MPALFALLYFFLALPACAADTSDDAAQAAAQTVVSLQAQEQTDLTQDTLVATLVLTKTDLKPGNVQAFINKTMTAAAAAAQKVPDVQATTGTYQVYEHYAYHDGKRQGPRQWRGEQTLILKGQDNAAVLELAREIQGMGLVMRGLDYTLSPAKARSVQDQLMVRAIERLQEKIALIAKTLGTPHYQIKTLTLSDGSYQPQPRPYMVRSAAMVADAAVEAAPVALAGQETIQFSVNADVVFRH